MSPQVPDHDIPERLRELEASASEPAWDRMEQRLLGAFAECRASGASHTASAPRHWSLSGTGRLAAAAVVVFAAAITFYARPEPRRVPPAKPADAPHGGEKTQPATGPAATSSTPGAAQKTTNVPSQNSKPGTRVANVKSSRPDALLPMSDAAAAFGDFVALPGASSLPDFESGRIMRIELPLTGLPAYGLDMVLDAAPGTIEADLLVGQDGVPRAIRLASAESR
jgi:hypothetical protein